MAGWADVARIALELPDTSEGTSHGNRSWQVRDKSFVWERPLRTSDLRHLGGQAPPGPIVGVRTADLGAKEALLASNPDAFFTTPHFDGYAAVLVQLDKIGLEELEEVIVEAWIARAPKRLASKYVAERFGE